MTHPTPSPTAPVVGHAAEEQPSRAPASAATLALDARGAPLPDNDWEEIGKTVFPVKDGRGWRKACEVCALRTSDPQDLGYRYQQDISQGFPDAVFYCVHRRTGHKQHRVCACYAALHGIERISK